MNLKKLLTLITKTEKEIENLDRQILSAKRKLGLSPIKIVRPPIQHQSQSTCFGIQTIPAYEKDSTKIITYTAESFLNIKSDEIEAAPYTPYFGKLTTRDFIIANAKTNRRFQFKTLIQKKDGSVYLSLVNAGFINGVLNQFYKIICPVPSFKIITLPTGKDPYHRKLVGADAEGLRILGYGVGEMSDLIKSGQCLAGKEEKNGFINKVESYFKNKPAAPPFPITSHFTAKNGTIVPCYLQVYRHPDGTYESNYIPFSFLN